MVVIRQVLLTVLLYLATLVSLQAQPLRVEKFTPQGQDSIIERASVKFSADVLVSGTPPDSVSPVAVTCNGQRVNLRGRWQSSREWEGDFGGALPSGSRCQAVISLASNAEFLPVNYQFSTAAPAVIRAWPDNYERIDENQAFILQTNAPSSAVLADVFKASKPFCSSSLFGEQVPLQLVKAEEAAAILQALKNALPKKIDQTRLLVARCARPLGEDAKVKIVWGRAIEFNTRPAFKATLNCEREQANKPCIPVRPVTLNFSSPISAKQAKLMTLKSPSGGTVAAAVPSDEETEVTRVQFLPPFQEAAKYEIKFPANLQDVFGRNLSAASAEASYFSTGSAPPLAKFAARFGIVERQVGALPVTIRNLGETANAGATFKIKSELSVDDATVVQWLRASEYESGREYATREVPVLAGNNSLNAFAITNQKSSQELQVVGIPLTQTGLHRVEIESGVLGKALLEAGEGAKANADKKMYVRTYALVTGMAVHLKVSPENALVWVTSLETGKVVPQADINVLDCNGKSLWKGVTDISGIARIEKALPKGACTAANKKIFAMFKDKSKPDADIDGDDSAWYLATARKEGDYSFVSSQWNQGIEPWRFNVNTSYSTHADDALLGHTVFARNLLRQSEVVHMKHLFRRVMANGLKRPGPQLAKRFTQLEIKHLGSDQTYTVPLKWLGQDGSSGTAISEWAIPAQAKLGLYSVRTTAPRQDSKSTEVTETNIELGSFQVAEFRLPTIKGVIDITQAVKDNKAAVAVQMSYLNGGAAAGLTTSVSALASRYSPAFSGYDEFQFRSAGNELGLRQDGDSDAEASGPIQNLPPRLKTLQSLPESRLLADKKELKLDPSGAGKISIDVPAKVAEPQTLRVEVNYPDPNGEIQTIANSSVLWPSQYVIGFKNSEWWAGADRSHQLVVLTTKAKPVAGVNVSVEGFKRQTFSARTRTVGGFYTYENSMTFESIGEVCSGKTNDKGLFDCNVAKSKTKQANSASYELLMLASVKDKDGGEALAGKQVWTSGSSNSTDSWSAQENSDRIDLVPEKRTVAAGETAKFQLRMPFEKATALVAVEREGIVDSFVVDLERGNATIEVPIKAEHAPNVMVSVLAIRPRLEPISWGSFFKWGWRTPIDWWTARQASLLPATALVDLAKPSFRFALTEIQVPAAPSLNVAVTTSPEKAQPREMVTASIQVTPIKGAAPVAGVRVAVAVVDEALFELRDNESWDVVAGLWQRRNYNVQTSTAQMQVIGKRHFGLKAQAPGGGGGRRPTRELLDTLAYWNPDVALDAQGKAQVQFKVNDSLTRFRVMVLAELGDEQVGTGNGKVDVSKDLQIISGLPPVVRQGDQIVASATLRNTTALPMTVLFSATAADNGVSGNVGSNAAAQTINLAAQASQQVVWPVTYPLENLEGDLRWVLKATATPTLAKQGSSLQIDELAITQIIKPVVLPSIFSSQLVRLDGPQTLSVQTPSKALPGRSLIKVDFSEKLGGALPGVRRYFEQYPFYCLEQRVSKAVGLRNPALWKIITDSLPTYLDQDGLAAYYPSERTTGSDFLTAYVLAAAHAAQWQLPEESQEKMLNGLSLFAQGKLKRDLYSPRGALGVESARLITAVEALALYGKATPAMLSVVDASPEKMALWPTAQVIDWVSAVARINFNANALKQKEQWLAQGFTVLRNRMRLSGTELTFDNEARDDWWWMMQSSDTNAARLLYVIMDSRAESSALIAEWLQDMPKLVVGLMGRQRNAAWSTTTGNLWGSFAMAKYASVFERDAVSGATSLEIANPPAGVLPASNWQQGMAKPLQWRWPKEAAASSVQGIVLKHAGVGKPYATVQVEAALPVTSMIDQGYRLSKKIIPVSQSVAGKVTVGDVYRVELDIDASQSMTWVAVSDPIPAGASILGSLRASQVELAKSANAATKPTGNEDRWSYAWLAFEEQRADAYRAFYEFMPKGKTQVSYTFRVSQAGTMKMPVTQAEAMYKPVVNGALPNADWVISAK